MKPGKVPGPVRIRKALRTIGLWSNRANDAYAMGEADWVHPPPTYASHLTAIACYLVKWHGDTPEGWEAAAFAVENEAKSRGIDPKRHRWHSDR